MADSKLVTLGVCSLGCSWNDACLVFVSKSLSRDFTPTNLLLPGSVTPLLDGIDTLMLVKRQVPLDCVLYRYGSFSLTLDIVRESCLYWGPRKGRYKLPGLASSSITCEKLLETTLMAEIVLGEHLLGFLVYGLVRGMLTYKVATSQRVLKMLRSCRP